MGQVADDVVNGQACAHCGVYFEKPNGHPALCTSCFQDQIDRDPMSLDPWYPKTRTREL